MVAAVKAAVTPNKIKQAEEQARQLCLLAYAPQPVAQPDGTTIALCWSGRIARAYDRLAEARTEAYNTTPKPNMQTAKVKAIEERIADLERGATAAYNAANQAASDWAALCTAAGVEFDPLAVYAPVCTCEGCKAQQAATARRNAYAALTEATYALLAPESFTLPPFVELMRRANDEHARNALWAHWKRMLDAAEVYIAACQADGVEPDWRGVLWPGDAT